jgi:hypothetical protein
VHAALLNADKERAAGQPPKRGERFSVQRQFNSRGWLHRVSPRKRHQMRHLVTDSAQLQSRSAPASEHDSPAFRKLNLKSTSERGKT